MGDEIEVFLEQVEDSEGQLILSKSRADFLRVWDRIYKSFEARKSWKAPFLDGSRAEWLSICSASTLFCRSQIDLRQIPDMDSLIGKIYKFRVIKLNKARRNIVVSRRVILEEDRNQLREKILAELEKGQVAKARLKTLRTSAPLSISAASTDCCILPTCRGAA